MKRPESYIPKSCFSNSKGQTLPLTSQRRTFYDNYDNSENFQIKNTVIITHNIKNTDNKSPSGIKKKVKGYFTNLLEKSLDYFVHRNNKQIQSNIHRPSSDSLSSTQNDFEIHLRIGSVLSKRTNLLNSSNKKCCKDELIDKTGYEQSTISCEVLRNSELIQHCSAKYSFRRRDCFSKSCSFLEGTHFNKQNSLLSKGSSFSREKIIPSRNENRLKYFKRFKSESDVGTLFKKEQSLRKEEFLTSLHNQNEKGYNSLLRMSTVQSMRVGIMLSVNNKLRSPLSFQVRHYNKQSHISNKHAKPTNDRVGLERKEYGEPYDDPTHSPAEKWINSSKALLNHIKKHVREKHRNIQTINKSQNQPIVADRGKIKSVRTESHFDDIKPLLLVLGNAKQLAYEMKRLIKPTNVEEYFNKERAKTSKKANKTTHVGPQRSAIYLEKEKQNTAPKLKATFWEHCNKLESSSKKSPETPASYGKRYTYRAKRYKTEKTADISEQEFSKDGISDQQAMKNPTLVRESSAPVPNLVRGHKHPTFKQTKVSKELQSSVSDSLLNRVKNLVYEIKTNETKYEQKNKPKNLKTKTVSKTKMNYTETKSETINKRENPKSFDESQMEIPTFNYNLHNPNSRELHLWRRRQAQLTPVDMIRGNTKHINIHEPKMNEEYQQKDSNKSELTTHYNYRGKLEYINEIKPSKPTTKLTALTRTNNKEESTEKLYDSRITPESLLLTRTKSGIRDNAYMYGKSRKMSTFNRNSFYENNPSLNSSKYLMNKIPVKPTVNSNGAADYFNNRGNFKIDRINNQPGRGTLPTAEKNKSSMVNESGSLYFRKSIETSFLKSGKNRMSIFDERVLKRGKGMENSHHNDKATENSYTAIVRNRLTEDSLLSNTGNNNLMLGRYYTRNSKMHNSQPDLENSDISPVRNSVYKQKYEYNNSLTPRKSETHKKSVYLKDKYKSENSSEYQKNLQKFLNRLVLDSRNFKSRRERIYPSITDINDNSPRSKSVDSFLLSRNSKITREDVAITDSKHRIKQPTAYEDYVKKNKLLKTVRIKNRMFMNSEQENKSTTNRNSTDYMNYFKNEFNKMNEWIEKKDSDKLDSVFKNYEKNFLREPRNKLQPSELTAKLKNYSSVPEIRNENLVNHFVSRVNNAKSKYIEQSKDYIEEVHRARERSTRHNNIIPSSKGYLQANVQKQLSEKTAEASSNKELPKIKKLIINSDQTNLNHQDLNEKKNDLQQSDAVEDELADTDFEKKEVQQDTEHGNKEDMSSDYHENKQESHGNKEELSSDYHDNKQESIADMEDEDVSHEVQKSQSDDTFITRESLTRRNYELILKKRLETNNLIFRNTPSGYSKDFNKMFRNEADETTRTLNPWYNSVNGATSNTINITPSLSPSETVNKYNT